MGRKDKPKRPGYIALVEFYPKCSRSHWRVMCKGLDGMWITF